MSSRILAIAVAVAAIFPAPATAAETREFCPDRPGLGTPPCTIDRGRGDVEIGLADWTLEKSGGDRTDTWLLGDLLVRYGLTDHLEMQFGWTSFGTVREPAGGSVGHSSGTGDVTLALRQNLIHPDGSGFSAALMPYATLPTGGRAIGAGDWSAGLMVPLSYELPHGLTLDLTGRIEAAADGDRNGRHLAYGGIAGLDVSLPHDVTATLELSAQRDEDPGGHSTQWVGGLSLAWMARPDLQLDAGANAGLAGGAPDAELYLGIARRF
jgi:Putative MetA-pathway of phenol degradation